MTDEDPDLYVVRSKSERRRIERRKALPTWGETPEQTRARRTALVKRLALAAGFSRVGIARSEPLDADRKRLEAWLAAGMHGQMAWLADDVARRCDPGLVVAGAKAVIVLALDYDTDQPHTREVDLADEDRGWIARYAWGDDYHLVCERRLKRLTDAVTAALKPELGDAFRPARDFRYSVDHGPVLERAWAVRAGLGWQGKHSLVLHSRHGSWFFLATVVTTLDLEPDTPVQDQCGSCTACLDACPTRAIVQPYVVDARKCISHATIEVDGALSDGLRALVGDHVFGCDLCQDVCPWNRFSTPTADPAFQPRPGLMAPDLAQLAALDEAGFSEKFAQSAVKRRGLAGLRDNVSAVRAGRAARAAPANQTPPR
jgi:epoxyqueuosine reductase